MPLIPQGAPQGAGLPPELLAALQSGGAPPDPTQGGVPPELMQLLQDAGGPPDQASQLPPSSPAQGDGTDPLEHLRMAIEHAQAAQVSEPDDADSAKLSKLVAGLYQILADRQKMHDQAMGNPAVARVLRGTGG
jgi:hypothetical protein